MSCAGHLHWLLWIIGSCFTEYFLITGHFHNLFCLPSGILGILITILRSKFGTSEDISKWQIVQQRNISSFVQVFEFNFVVRGFSVEIVQCGLLEKPDVMGCWYTGLRTCLWSVRVRFSELNVAQRLHLRPGWKDYSVSIFINPGPFPSPCFQLPQEAFIYRGLSLTALHYIFIFTCLVQLRDTMCAFNAQWSTLLGLNGENWYKNAYVWLCMLEEYFDTLKAWRVLTQILYLKNLLSIDISLM